MTRTEILEKFRNELKNGRVLLGVGAGTGITAKSSEMGGADMLIIYNSGRYRMAGRGSLAGLLSYGDANQIVIEMGHEVLPVVKEIPVLAGVCGTDPFRIMDVYLRELKSMGFSGVQNFPTVGLIDGVFRQNLEETGMGYGLEVEMIRKAHELDMLAPVRHRACRIPTDAEDDWITAVRRAPAITPNNGFENLSNRFVNSGTSARGFTAELIISIPYIRIAKPIKIVPISFNH